MTPSNRAKFDSRWTLKQSFNIMMLINFVMGLTGLLNVVSSREIRSAKPMPVISNSLLNFGKMDISIYLNDKLKDALTKHDSFMNPSSSLFSSLHDSHNEPCPCSNLRNMKDSLSSHPSEILNKVLMSSDLFLFNKEHLTSSLCCDSHESVREEGIFFEFSPKQNQLLANSLQSSQLILPSLTRVLENVIPRRPTLPIKPQTMDIFLLPKKKTVTAKETESPLKKKPDIHAVGDNEIKDNTKILSSPTFSYKSSVKKDLGKKKPNEEPLSDSEPKIVTSVTNKSNTI